MEIIPEDMSQQLGVIKLVGETYQFRQNDVIVAEMKSETIKPKCFGKPKKGEYKYIRTECNDVFKFVTDLEEQIVQIFGNDQLSASLHRKNMTIMKRTGEVYELEIEKGQDFLHILALCQIIQHVIHAD